METPVETIVEVVTDTGVYFETVISQLLVVIDILKTLNTILIVVVIVGICILIYKLFYHFIGNFI